MTWIDWSLIIVLVAFLAAGARLGSIWTSACLCAGFASALAADTYGLALADRMGTFSGADLLAYALLFVLSAALVLGTGWFLSRLCKGLMLGVLDAAFGLLTGAAAGLLTVSVALLILVPFLPSMESTAAWRRSTLTRPLYRQVEEFLETPRFARHRRPRLEPIAEVREKAAETITDVAGKIAHRVKG